MIKKVRDREKPSALRTSVLFTNRADELQTIIDEYDLLKQNPGNASVINISGIPGIGKTSLLEKLMQNVSDSEKASKKDANILYYSFERIHEKNEEQFLLNFAYQILEQKPNTDLSTFFYVYKKLLSATEPEDQVLEQIKEAHFVKKRGFEILATIASDFVPFGGSTFSLIVEKLLDKIERKADKKSRDEIDGSSETELRERIHQYFSYEARDYFEKLDVPYIVILDGYEKYLNLKGDYDNRREKWIMDLVEQLPNVLWIISGREKISWDEDFGVIDIDLTELSVKHVNEMFDTYRDRYDAIDIRRELRDHVYELTKGVPVYLRLCLENYDQCSDKENITPDDIGKDTEALLRRFFDNYSENQKRIMVLLCFLPDGFSAEKAYEIFGKYDKITFMSIFDSLKDTAAFEDTGAGYRIHSVVRKSVLENADSLNSIDVFSEIVNTLTEVAESYEEKGLWGKAIFYREELCKDIETWCHTHKNGEKILAAHMMSLAEDHYSRYEKLYRSEDSAACKLLYEGAIEILKGIYEPGSWPLLSAKASFISCIVLEDASDELLSLANECFDIVKKEHADEKNESLKYVFNLWNYTWENNWDMLSYIDELLAGDVDDNDPRIAEIREDVEEFYETRQLDEELPEEFWKDQEEAAEQLKQDEKANEDEYNKFITEYDPQKDYDDEACRSLKSLASCLRYQNYDVSGAEDVLRRLREIYLKKSGGRETVDSISALLDIADYMNDVIAGSLEKAESEFKNAYELILENKDLRSELSVATVLLQLADVCYEQGKTDDALKYYRELESEQKRTSDIVMDPGDLRTRISDLSEA